MRGLDLASVLDPVELSKYRAEERALAHNELGATLEDDHVLGQLDGVASMLGFIGLTYMVESRRTLAIPCSFEASQPVEIEDRVHHLFIGRFVCYSRIGVNGLYGSEKIRALCLTFTDVDHFGVEIEETKLLVTPVLAVEDIRQTAA